MQILDGGLECVAIAPRDAAAENDADFVGLADRAVGIEQPFAQRVQCRRNWARPISARNKRSSPAMKMRKE